MATAVPSFCLSASKAWRGSPLFKFVLFGKREILMGTAGARAVHLQLEGFVSIHSVDSINCEAKWANI